MRLRQVEELEPRKRRAVTINVDTDLFTTRALLSAERHTSMPILLLNCDPSESSRNHFDRLMEQIEFDTIEIPLRRHGDTLDWLFSLTQDDQILLIDSDAEIRDPSFVEWMERALDDPRVFGSGYSEGPFWMTEDWLAPPRSLLYMERPWVPCVLLRSAEMKVALRAGCRFAEHMVPNEIRVFPRVANLLAARFPPPWARQSRIFSRLPQRLQTASQSWRLDFLSPTCRPYFGLRPKMVCYDTGALVYEYLRYQRELIFAGLDIGLMSGQVQHYLGVTRSGLFGPTPLDTIASSVEEEVSGQLFDHYGYQWPADVV